MNAVDTYVLYDNIEYTKKGWINRNRILLNGKDHLFTIPIKKDSDYLDVCQRMIADDYNRSKISNIINEAYRKAPNYDIVSHLLENIIQFKDSNLFNYIFHSIVVVNNFLGINTKIIPSSSVSINHSLKGQEKVLAICKNLGASEYYNAIGGQNLYDKNAFKDEGIILQFLKPFLVPYKQYNNDFIEGLSIIDVLMFNSVEETKKMLDNYELI